MAGQSLPAGFASASAAAEEWPELIPTAPLLSCPADGLVRSTVECNLRRLLDGMLEHGHGSTINLSEPILVKGDPFGSAFKAADVHATNAHWLSWKLTLEFLGRVWQRVRFAKAESAEQFAESGGARLREFDVCVCMDNWDAVKQAIAEFPEFDAQKISVAVRREMIRCDSNTLESKDDEIVADGGRNYSARGEQVLVTENEDNVLQAFLIQSMAMDESMMKDVSGVSQARTVLRDLTTKHDGIFALAITLPGGNGRGGYRVSIRAYGKR